MQKNILQSYPFTWRKGEVIHETSFLGVVLFFSFMFIENIHSLFPTPAVSYTYLFVLSSRLSNADGQEDKCEKNSE